MLIKKSAHETKKALDWCLALPFHEWATAGVHLHSEGNVKIQAMKQPMRWRFAWSYRKVGGRFTETY